MTVKRQAVITKKDFAEALEELHVSVSGVSKETGIPRAYLSAFLNHGNQLSRECAAKLRDFFEGKGIEFLSDLDDAADPEDDTPASPHPRLTVGAVFHFPVRGDLAPDLVRATVTEIDRNDARAAELLERKVTRRLVSDESYSKETEGDIRELFALFGANWTLLRYLTGVKNPLAAPAEKDTINQVLLDTVRESVERAGIATQDQAAAAGEEETPAAKTKPGAAVMPWTRPPANPPAETEVDA